ncbi:MAG TPA: hypothetical protein VFI91_14100, partial [Longimicrobiaceae bacterium]|nr:hypothetical protein [Longimicrobiaceae bacterium]
MTFPLPNAILAALSVTLFTLSPATATGQSLLGTPAAASASVATPSGGGTSMNAALASSGWSGALRVMIAEPTTELRLPVPADLSYRWTALFENSADLLGKPSFSTGPLRSPEAPGVWRLETGDVGEPSSRIAVITEVPFEAKVDGYLNGYHIGRYPVEGSGRNDEYAPPEGFIEVTPANQDFYVSEHFQIRDFLTKDQFDVWPKYVALDLQLIDKLELVLQELNKMGIRADHLEVMSGFRTPQYNDPGGNGRATLSRHTYG